MYTMCSLFIKYNYYCFIQLFRKTIENHLGTVEYYYSKYIEFMTVLNVDTVEFNLKYMICNQYI